MKLIDRNQYLDKMISVIGTPDIKVITGVRRSGKSKLLEAFKDYVETEYTDYNIVHINFNRAGMTFWNIFRKNISFSAHFVVFADIFRKHFTSLKNKAD